MEYNFHGADIYTASKNSGIDENCIIDFSSNINPLGIHENVNNAIINSIKHANRYPDINNRELISSLSAHEKIPKAWIFCSNGAAEAIFRIALYLKPKKALLTAPTFSEYEQALKAVGCNNIDYFNLNEENEFKITDQITDSISDGTDIIFICNPNNPTGQLTDKALLERVVSHCRTKNIKVVIDECFMDFVENKEKHSVVDLLEKYDNLIILKAFTKIYAIPGIRLGYCMTSDIETINGLKVSGPPWSVSVAAQAAGVAALEEKDYILKSVTYVNKQRRFLMREMKKLKLRAYEANANYILFKYTGDKDLHRELMEKNILIRSCSDYKCLGSQYYRIAVKSEYDNKLILKKLKEIMVSK